MSVLPQQIFKIWRNRHSKGLSLIHILYKADGTLAKSGKLKTGFTAVIDSKTYVIAVCGDVTGEGNVNSKDFTLLQKHLCDNAELDGAYPVSYTHLLRSE